jgi:hypothetical protein
MKPAVTAPSAPLTVDTAKFPTDGNSEYDSIARCCNALKSAADQRGDSASKYTVAAAVCSGIARQVKKGGADPSSARTLIRAQLQGVSVPAGC